MNLVELPVVDGGVQFGTATVPVSRTELQSTASRTVIVDVRPEDLATAQRGIESNYRWTRYTRCTCSTRTAAPAWPAPSPSVSTHSN
jgi:hypothetical protein